MSWDLTGYFPQFNGPEMRRFKDVLHRDISALKDQAAPLAPLARHNLPAWEEVLLRHEDLSRRMSHLASYVGCLSSADARNEDYHKEEAIILRMRADLGKIRIELLRAFKGCSDETFSALGARAGLNGAGHYLTRLREESSRAMSAEKEILAADLGLNGLQAWGRLYNTLSSKLEFEMAYPDGRRERVPLSQRRSLLDHPDRCIRKMAFEGGNVAWRGVGDVAAAALNAIAGTRLTLNRHRGVSHFLDIALFQSGLTHDTLEAMFAALFARLDIPRRVLRLKARRMGAASLCWYDLGAPLDLPNSERLSWEKGRTLVERAFARVYPALGDFFRMIINKKWVDWEPRASKRPGGYCTTSMLSQESRIFMTYNESLNDVLTLAHESGHAFHGFLMRPMRPYARIYPMTLAETASTFGELILIHALADDSSVSDALKAVMLDAEVGQAAIYLLDIPVRFEFEKALYEEREHGELVVSRLKELMVQTQRRILGDVLEPGGEDPYFWASKLHFYITGLTFYNFPYTFGFLLSRGLYAFFKKEGAAFLSRYEEFLRLAGSDKVESVVKRTLGCDLEKPDFWATAIESLEEPLTHLESLLPMTSGT
ncbi:MAG TPA: M3 family oligoendopeptidase [Terriglobales bacterium]|nr:M3 family oligoendopeptidase [Terriglobales bacterium]